MPGTEEASNEFATVTRLIHALTGGEDIEGAVESALAHGDQSERDALSGAIATLQRKLGWAESLRRTHEVIVELARELTDPDMGAHALLQVIVDRTRMLLQCDFTYLSINDDEKAETYFKATSGALTDMWKTLRIPFGIGLGGRIAATGRPVISTDYLDDESLLHAASTDSASTVERQRAIMGAPLIHQGRVIGVLYASNRTPARFLPEEQDLLSAFAALAAVGIERSRLFAELSAANESLRVRGAEVQRAIEAHDLTMEILLHGGGMDDIIDSAVQILGGEFAVVGTDSDFLARSTGVDAEMRQAMTSLATLPIGESARAEHLPGFYRSGLVAGEKGLGWLIWRPKDSADPVSESELRIFEQTGVVASLLLLFNENVSGVQRRMRGELLADLLSAIADNVDVSPRRLSRVRYRPHGPQVLVAVEVAPQHRARVSALLADEAASQDGLSGTHEGIEILVLPAQDASEVAHATRRAMSLRVGGEVTVGASSVIDSAQELPRAFTEAVGCLRALVRLGRAGTSASVADLGFIGLLIGNTASAGDFVDRVLGPVIEHDRRRSTELMRTLEVYLRSGQSLIASAQTLHIHVNTVSQRLNRCKEILGSTWTDPDGFLEVQLALRLRAVARE